MSTGIELVNKLLEKGFSKYRISKQLGVSWKTVNEWHKGKSQPRQTYAITLKEMANG